MSRGICFEEKADFNRTLDPSTPAEAEAEPDDDPTETTLPDSAKTNESDEQSESSNVSNHDESPEDGTLEGED